MKGTFEWGCLLAFVLCMMVIGQEIGLGVNMSEWVLIMLVVCLCASVVGNVLQKGMIV